MKKINFKSVAFKMPILKERQITGAFFMALFIFGGANAFAGGGIDGALGSATAELQGISGTLSTLIYAVGGIVGVIGGLRIFNKWNNGDSDINKELVGWGGAALFLFLAPTIMTAFFGF